MRKGRSTPDEPEMIGEMTLAEFDRAEAAYAGLFPTASEYARQRDEKLLATGVDDETEILEDLDETGDQPGGRGIERRTE